jgi:hypothetical protein
MEHRCGYRRTVNVSVVVRTTSGLVGKALLSEISASGAHLVTSLPLTLETLIRVRFENERGERFSVEAEIVRGTATGFGLEWSDFAPECMRCFFVGTDEASAAEPASTEQIFRRIRGV